MENVEKGVIVLFRFGAYSFALPKDYIENIVNFLPLVSAGFLPKIFSGFFAFGKNHLPCLMLDKLMGGHDFAQQTLGKQPKVVILRSFTENPTNKLAVLADEVDATFIPRKEHLVPLRKEYRKNKWLQGEIAFGEKSYLLINEKNLLLSIENYCLAEISNHSAL